MSNLILDSLEIKNFRAFQHLRIEKLGRVNLIVGKNNVGKTSVLEALWIYAEQGEPAFLHRLLTQRDEVATDQYEARRVAVSADSRALALNNLFFDRIDTRQPHAPIRIGSVNNKLDLNTVQIDVQWPSQNAGTLQEMMNKAYVSSSQPPMLTLEFGPTNIVGISLGQDFFERERMIPIGFTDYVKASVVWATGLSLTELAERWDEVALTDLERDIIDALRIITPQIVAVNMTGSGHLDGLRTPKARLSGSSVPAPFRSMGEGMNRLFGIALALVNAKDGMLLVDEVDTGLHYSVLPDLWKLIFEVAHRLNVQVFATTHSKDCLEAFQESADDNKEEEGVLIRLENRKAGVVAVTFDESELAIVTRERIEVR